MSEEFLKPCNEIQFFNPSISDFFKITCLNLFHHKNIRFHVYPLEKKASGKKKVIHICHFVQREYRVKKIK